MGTQLHHVSISVTDMKRNLYLFKDILGFELKWHIPCAGGKRLSTLLGIPGIEVELAYLQSPQGGVALELSRLLHPTMDAPTTPFSSSGSVSLSLTVEDLEQMHARLTEEGWKPLSPCLNLCSPAGDSFRAFCLHTGDGLTLELIGEQRSR